MNNEIVAIYCLCDDRLYRVEPMLLVLFEALGQAWKRLNTESVYSIDSFPIPVCDNIRIPRSKIYDGNEEYRGYQASKKRYFYGLKIHLMATESGEPVEFFLTSGSFADVRGMKVFPFALPEGCLVYADKAYNDYAVEDLLLEVENIQLSAMRKSNSKRPVPVYVQFLQHHKRKVIESTGSLISQLYRYRKCFWTSPRISFLYPPRIIFPNSIIPFLNL